MIPHRNIEIDEKQTDERYQKNNINDKESDERDQISKIDEEKITEYKEITKLQNLSKETETINRKNKMV